MLNTTPANRAHLLVANTKHAQGCTGAPVLVVIALIAVEYSSRPRFNDTVVFAHTGYADMQMAAHTRHSANRGQAATRCCWCSAQKGTHLTWRAWPPGGVNDSRARNLHNVIHNLYIAPCVLCDVPCKHAHVAAVRRACLRACVRVCLVASARARATGFWHARITRHQNESRA